MWRAEPEEVKEYYDKQADIKKAEHLELHPGESGLLLISIKHSLVNE